MKRKTKKIISLIIVLAIVVTTVLSTVVAVFAEDMYDYGFQSTAIDYSQVRPSQASIDLQAEKNWEKQYQAYGSMQLSGIPDGAYVDSAMIGNVTSSNANMAFSDVSLSWNEVSFTVTGTGSTMLSFTLNGYPISFMVNVTPKYDFSNIGLAETSVTHRSTSSWIDFNVALTGVPEGADTSNLDITDVKSSNKNMYVSISAGDGSTLSVSVEGDGTTTVTFNIEGKPLSLTINFINIRMSQLDYRLAKGKTKQLSVKGVTGPVTYESLNPSVATVTADGRVKAIKNGTAVIKVKTANPEYTPQTTATTYQEGSYDTLDETPSAVESTLTLGTVINVGSAKKIKAFNWARRYASKSTYSQAKRMQKGYYDCSSLVWRAYHSQKINLMQKNWAPTAADLGKYLVGKGKEIDNATEENYQTGEFQVGDLLFETGEDNGRFRGIYHVEMFGGYTFGGFDDTGNPYLITTYAARGDGYGYGADCFLCRP